MVLAVAELFAVEISMFGVSAIAAVFEIWVPPAVPAGTVTTSENVADVIAARVVAEQL
jgi:hypothetical protein